MSDVLLPFGRAKDGRLVHIDDVESGLQSDVVCPQCRTPLIAAKGDVYAHHFRHHTDAVVCAHTPESDLHQFAKQVICETLKVDYPHRHISLEERFYYDVELGELTDARPEVTLAGGAIRADLTAQFGNETVAIEIYVAHAVDDAKIALFQEHEIAAFEIDLRDFRFADKSKAEWLEAVQSRALRVWLNPPRKIREAEEAARLAYIAEQNRIAQVAQQEHQRAEQYRLEQQRKYDFAQSQGEHDARIDTEHERREIERQRVAWQAAKQEEDRLAVLAREQKEIAEAAAAATAARFQRLDNPPDLQQLVRAHGGYHRITPLAWEKWDKDNVEWQARRRERLRREQAQSATLFRDQLKK